MNDLVRLRHEWETGSEEDDQRTAEPYILALEAEVERLERSRDTFADGLEQEEAENQALHEKFAALQARVAYLEAAVRATFTEAYTLGRLLPHDDEGALWEQSESRAALAVTEKEGT